MKVKNIINGWGNLLRSKTIGVKDHIQAQADQRLAICKSCNLYNGTTCSTKKANHVVTGEELVGCGCPISAKVMSQHDTCPIGKWQQMLNKKVWNFATALANYDKVAIRDNNIKADVMLYNLKEENMFASIDKTLTIPYMTMAMYAAKHLVKTVKLIDAREVLNYSERAKIFMPSESFITMLNSQSIDVPNQTSILWVTRSMAEEMSEAKFQNAMDWCNSEIFNKTKKQVYYIVTDTWNSDIKKELDNLGIFYEDSILCEVFLNLNDNDYRS